jgi:two-component system cell cycle response regulator
MSARILVVDDIPANVRLLEAKLSAEYFEVLTASSGREALEIAARDAPDLIMLDVMMPEMDGFEVARRLRSDPKTQHIPIVMVTALSETRDRVRGLDAGADDFLTKPVNDIALLARVRSLTRLKVMIDELRVRQAASGRIDGASDAGDGADDSQPGDILLVESEPVMATALRKYLSDAGHGVRQARSGREAAYMLRGRVPDLIIVNLNLEGEDGLRLCSQFRSNDETRHIPILLILDSNELAELAKGLDLGVTDYLIRPIDKNELLARTRTQIRRRRYHDRLRSMLDRSVSLAYTDALTGVYNRRYMNAHLDRKIMEIGDDNKPVSILLFDLDNFKAVNDSHGHAAGDEILKGVARRVEHGVRDFDMLARYGGEEFVVIMPTTASDVAAAVAERLRKSIEAEPFAAGDGQPALKVTVSIGVATTNDPMESAGSLLARADDALYAAKRGGRDRVCVAPQRAADEAPRVGFGP